jgi:hypothetical protein
LKPGSGTILSIKGVLPGHSPLTGRKLNVNLLWSKKAEPDHFPKTCPGKGLQGTMRLIANR